MSFLDGLRHSFKKLKGRAGVVAAAAGVSLASVFGGVATASAGTVPTRTLTFDGFFSQVPSGLGDVASLNDPVSFELTYLPDLPDQAPDTPLVGQYVSVPFSFTMQASSFSLSGGFGAITIFDDFGVDKYRLGLTAFESATGFGPHSVGSLMANFIDPSMTVLNSDSLMAVTPTVFDLLKSNADITFSIDGQTLDMTPNPGGVNLTPEPATIFFLAAVAGMLLFVPRRRRERSHDTGQEHDAPSVKVSLGRLAITTAVLPLWLAP